MQPQFDLFFSYRRLDLERAKPLLAELEKQGIRVWRDEQDIPETVSISTAIRNAIAGSKALIAFFSASYPASTPCQQELTNAWLAAERLESDASRRVWIVNAEKTFEHIPQLFRDQQSRYDPTSAGMLARELAGRLANVESSLGTANLDTPAYFPIRPVQGRRFVGRANEFWDLHAKLIANRLSIITGVYGQSVAQVRGLGGNGKSYFAREYSIRFGPAYPGGVYWLDANGDPSRNVQIRAFAMHLGITVDNRRSQEIEADFWRELEKRKLPCLWIVDDVPAALDSTTVEQSWYARCSNTSTLITTRSREYGASGDFVDLGVLTSSEASQLLRLHRVPSKEEAPAMAAIIEMLGHHPLALDVAGSYLATGLQTFDEYLKDLADPSQDAVEFGAALREQLPTGHERRISATLLKSLCQLEKEGLDFLRLASLMAAASIQSTLIADVFQESGQYAVGRMAALQAIDQAYSLSLCEKEAADSYRVHALVIRTVQIHLKDENRLAALRNVAIKVLTRRLARVEDHRQHAGLATDLIHGRHLVSGALTDRAQIALGSRIAQFDYLRGDYASARNFQQKLADAAVTLLGVEDEATVRAMTNLAETMHIQGDLAAAAEIQARLLASGERVFGSDHPNTLVLRHNLAATVFERGDWARAQTFQEQTASLARRRLGNEHPHTLSFINSLAWTLYARGRFDTARDLQEEVVEQRKRILGADHANTLMAINNLAKILYSQGDFTAAKAHQEEYLTRSRNLLGEKHPLLVIAMDNLALTHRALKEFNIAQKLQEDALALARKVLPENHSDTLGVLNHLALTRKSQGDLREAREMQAELLTVLRRVKGAEHPDTLTAMHNLSLTLYAEGDHASALGLLHEAVRSLRKVLGDTHPHTSAAIEDLATLRGESAQF